MLTQRINLYGPLSGCLFNGSRLFDWARHFDQLSRWDLAFPLCLQKSCRTFTDTIATNRATDMDSNRLVFLVIPIFHKLNWCTNHETNTINQVGLMHKTILPSTIGCKEAHTPFRDPMLHSACDKTSRCGRLWWSPSLKGNIDRSLEALRNIAIEIFNNPLGCFFIRHMHNDCSIRLQEDVIHSSILAHDVSDALVVGAWWKSSDSQFVLLDWTCKIRRQPWRWWWL
mmetsp:Transcript_75899/g.119556  ORF Transcript_75899/g.119556 Transcript_75899/m.119556 type:complete len:227 (+) Transcript_75899:131-811(+)